MCKEDVFTYDKYKFKYSSYYYDKYLSSLFMHYNTKYVVTILTKDTD
jgi:hypothetical protein